MQGARRPVVLLPLRLEIRHINRSADGNKVRLAKYSYVEKLDENEKSYWLREMGKETDKQEIEPKREIWIRWYPDDCQVFPPVGRITEAEIAAYNSYINNDADWVTFSNSIGLHRARFLYDHFDGQTTDNTEGVDPFQEYNLGQQDTGEQTDDGISQLLAKGAKLKALPNTVKLYTITENKATQERQVVFLAEGNKIDIDNIALSGNELQDSSWTIDFGEAVKKGMGVKIIQPDKCEQVEKADWLIAVGHKDDEKVLEELFLRFKALGRFNILKQNSPTNNTETEKAVFIDNESGTELEKQSPDNNLATPESVTGLTNADVLAISLGLDKKVFAGLENSAISDQEARSRNEYIVMGGLHGRVSSENFPG